MSVSSFSIPVAHRLWAIIYLAGESSCRSVQYIIRPHLHVHADWLNYFLGVAPNFLAGIYVPACITFLMPYLLERDPSKRDFDPQKYMASAVILALAGLVGWELIQPLTKKFYFDPHDLLWTVIGVCLYVWILQWKCALRPSRPARAAQQRQREVGELTVSN